jgi:hypothetical protein
VEDLLAPLEQLSLCESHELLELSPFTPRLITVVYDSAFAEIVSLSQCLVDDEDQREEHAEADRPFLVAGCALVARPHHTTPGLEDLHDALSLDFEECEFDLSLYAACSGAFWVCLMENALYLVFGFFVEDETSFEDRGGYVDFEGLSEKFALEQSVSTISV